MLAWKFIHQLVVETSDQLAVFAAHIEISTGKVLNFIRIASVTYNHTIFTTSFECKCQKKTTV